MCVDSVDIVCPTRGPITQHVNTSNMSICIFDASKFLLSIELISKNVQSVIDLWRVLQAAAVYFGRIYKEIYTNIDDMLQLTGTHYSV